MIIGKNFIWLHYPKAGGSHIQKVLRKYFSRTKDEAVFDELDPQNVIWHHGIEERKAHDPSFDPEGKKIICGIRRLPSWYLSRIFFEYDRRPEFCVNRRMFLRGEFLEYNGSINNADTYLRIYNKNVTSWIRTEHMAEDFQRAFAEHLDLAVLDLDYEFSRRTNKTIMNYIKELGFYFTSEELQQLYQNNPVWAEVEESVYGNLLSV